MRSAEINRKTNETDIRVKLCIDGTGVRTVDTGIGFFNHMLDLFARHGLLDLTLTAKGDLGVDEHHTIEDTGIALGEAFAAAVGDKAGINRYATQFVPMDEALACVQRRFLGSRFFCSTTWTARTRRWAAYRPSCSRSSSGRLRPPRS